MLERHAAPLKSVLLVAATAAATCLAPPAIYAQDVVHVISRRVGVNTGSPAASLHVVDPTPTPGENALFVHHGDVVVARGGSNAVSFRFANGVRAWNFFNSAQGIFQLRDATSARSPLLLYPNAADKLLTVRGIGLGINNSNPTHPIHHGSGARLTAGGVWTNASSRALKTAFEEVDVLAVLAKVAALPVQSWRYKVEETDARHIGPVAEDFQSLFGLGDGEAIPTVDADGVALAAIQGLYNLLQERSAEIESLQEQVAELTQQLASRDAAAQ